MDAWVRVEDRLPDLGDYSVLAYFAANGGIDMIHVQDYFAPITNGRDGQGNLQYTQWYLSQGVTHWQPLPEPPIAVDLEPEEPARDLLAVAQHEDAYSPGHLDGAQ